MSINKDEDEEYNSFGMSFDNMVTEIGKIINYKFNSKNVQESLNELIIKWILNLPIKYDDTEQEQQHDWLVDLFLIKRQLIPENCYIHYFGIFVKIYKSKSVNETINKKKNFHRTRKKRR